MLFIEVTRSSDKAMIQVALPHVTMISPYGKKTFICFADKAGIEVEEPIGQVMGMINILLTNFIGGASSIVREVMNQKVIQLAGGMPS